MQRLLCWASLILGLVVALPHEVQAQKKKKDAPAAAPNTVDSEKLAAGDFTGVLRSVPGTDRVFTVELKQLVPAGGGGGGGWKNANPGIQQVLQSQQQAQQAQMRMATAKTPQQRNQARQQAFQAQARAQQAIARLNNAGNNNGGGQKGNGGKNNEGPQAPPGYKWDTSKTIEFQARADVKVRTLVLGDMYDDKGNLKKLTAKELSELKGKDKHLPGYEAGLEKLEAGQMVKVTLASTAVKKGTDNDDDVKDKKMQVKLILIETEAPPSSKNLPKQKKKK